LVYRSEVNGVTAAPASRDYRILITDDDPDCREALREIMEPEGFRTLLASCGEEALDIAQSEAVHLALLDMHMPTLTGLETLRMLRQIHALLPCILITADVTESLIREACQERAYSVIPKPVSKNVVLYTVVRALVRVYGTAESEPPA
jgi:two-component system, response regulator PdtaR